MGKIIRGCGNCFWIITDYDIEEIFRNNSSAKNDSDYPKSGCGLVLPDNKRWADNYYCREHYYIDGIFDTYVLYDTEYLGPGYFIINELNGEIAMFAKIYKSENNGKPHYNFKAFESSAFDSVTQNFRDIDLIIEQIRLESLFNSLLKLAVATNGDSIVTIDSKCETKDQFKVITEGLDMVLTFSKDVSGVTKTTDFVDVSIDNQRSEHYEAVNEFYQSLGASVERDTKGKDIQKIYKAIV